MHFGQVVLILSLALLAKAQVPGGWQQSNITDDDMVKKAAAFGTKKISESSNSIYHKKLVTILDSQQQVVAGIKYNITLEITHTTCKKNDVAVTNIDECAANNDLPIDVCEVIVWSQVWNKEQPLRLLENKCAEKKVKKIETSADQFQQFVTQYKRTYTTKQAYLYRQAVFENNLKRIKILTDHEKGTAKYGVTHFADLTAKEFRRSHLGFRPDLDNGNTPVKSAPIPEKLGDLPATFDWRDKGAVTEVKNQGSCGSCWAFSTTGNVEGQWFLRKGQLLSLSEQELVDCDTLDQGCNGGLPSNAYEQIEKLGGLELETDYPYSGRDQKCSFNKQLAKVTVNGYMNVSTDETEMAGVLVNTGPISIGINANAMQFYVGGVSHPPKFLCNPNNLDHGVLIVGYGSHAYPLFNTTLPFWIVKNSWGASWGEQGYYRVYRGDGTCGLNLMATSAIIN